MKKALRIVWLALVLAFIYVPILVLAVYSFTDASMVGGGINSFSFANYINLFKNDELRNMIFGTVLLALICSAISTVLATLGAIG
ncbi:MAG: ABC transporter permease, partial [Clostridia bacterium]|nr:ABC transporter permease [Clostridia bacterium]